MHHIIKKLPSGSLARKAAVFVFAFAVTLAAAACGLYANRYENPEAAGAVLVSAPQSRSGRDSVSGGGAAADYESIAFPVAADGEALEAVYEAGRTAETYESDEIGEIDETVEEDSPAAEEAVVIVEIPPLDWNAAVSMDDFVFLPGIPLGEDLQRHIYAMCIQNELDYTLVLALMWRESRFHTDAVGLNSNGTSDSGIMQINDINKQWLEEELGITDLMDPWQNITAGTTMLGRFVQKHGVHNAMLAYQYGETGMKTRLARGLTTSTQVEQLYAKWRDYAAMLV